MVDTVQEKVSSVGGLGFSSLDPENVLDIQGTVVPGAQAPTQPQQQAPQREQIRAPQIQTQAPSFRQNFKDNPLGTLGLIFSNIAAGFRGQPLPSDQATAARIQQRQSQGEILSNVFDFIKDQGEVIKDLPEQQARDARVIIEQIVAQMTGDPQGASNLVNTFLGTGSTEDFDRFLELQGLEEVAVELGLGDLSASAIAEIMGDPSQVATLQQMADTRFLGSGTDKARFAMSVLKEARGNQRLSNIPGSRGGTAMDDVNSLFDAGNNFTGTQAEILDAFSQMTGPDGQSFFNNGELGALRRNPAILQDATGARSPTVIAKAQEPVAPTNIKKLIDERNILIAEKGENDPDVAILNAQIAKSVSREGLVINFDDQGRIQSFTQGDIGATTGLLSKQDIIDFRDFKDSTQSSLEVGAEIIALIAGSAEPAAVASGPLGSAVRIAGATIDQVTGFVDLFKGNDPVTGEISGIYSENGDRIVSLDALLSNPNLVDELFDTGIGIIDKISDLGDDAALVKANLVRLAFAVAIRNNNGSARISDKDFEFALRQITGTAGDPSQNITVLRNNFKQDVEQFRRQSLSRKQVGPGATFETEQALFDDLFDALSDNAKSLARSFNFLPTDQQQPTIGKTQRFNLDTGQMEDVNG